MKVVFGAFLAAVAVSIWTLQLAMMMATPSWAKGMRADQWTPQLKEAMAVIQHDKRSLMASDLAKLDNALALEVRYFRSDASDAAALGRLEQVAPQRMRHARDTMMARRAAPALDRSHDPVVEIFVQAETTAEAERVLRGEVAPLLWKLGSKVLKIHPERRRLSARVNIPTLSEVVRLSVVRNVRSVLPRHIPSFGDRGHARRDEFTSQGDQALRADQLRQALHPYGKGDGVKIGVMSTGVDSLPIMQECGYLPLNVNVLDPGTGDEGTAMLQIVYDLAPNAELYFATAFETEDDFAANILLLMDAGCDIIVDDVIYFLEPPFQDGIVADAAASFVAQGGLYFSAAGNEGNRYWDFSGIWEGDFAYTDISGLGDVLVYEGEFIANQILEYNLDLAILTWSDEFDCPESDYDLYVISEDFSTILDWSAQTQNGCSASAAFEVVYAPFPAGSFLLVARFSGEDRFIRLNNFCGLLEFATDGQIWGHPAAEGVFAVAAIDVHLAEGGAFIDHEANLTSEFFSSSGFRRLFYDTDGNPLTPGVFNSSGGIVRECPSITAADGAASAVTGFNPFYGTSAAAPHAAAVTALLLSSLPSTNRSLLESSFSCGSIDIDDSGYDKYSGYGVIDAVSMYTCLNDVIGANDACNGRGKVVSGTCQCFEGYTGQFCDSCAAFYGGFPNCKLCSDVTAFNGSSCNCPVGFVGSACESCSPNYGFHPLCSLCSGFGSLNGESQCVCDFGYNGTACDQCDTGLSGFPVCSETHYSGFLDFSEAYTFDRPFCQYDEASDVAFYMCALQFAGDSYNRIDTMWVSGYCPDTELFIYESYVDPSTLLVCDDNNYDTGYDLSEIVAWFNASIDYVAVVTVHDRTFNDYSTVLRVIGPVDVNIFCESSCPCNYYLDGTSCVSCPSGTVSNFGSTDISDCVCASGFLPQPDGTCIPPCSGYGIWNGFQCVCDAHYNGTNCSECATNYGNFPACELCSGNGNEVDGKCNCSVGYAGDSCDQCDIFFGIYPDCELCSGFSDAFDGSGCNCSAGYAGTACDECAPFYGGSGCQLCSGEGSFNVTTNQCDCCVGYAGPSCDECAPGYVFFGGACLVYSESATLDFNNALIYDEPGCIVAGNPAVAFFSCSLNFEEDGLYWLFTTDYSNSLIDTLLFSYQSEESFFFDPLCPYQNLVCCDDDYTNTTHTSFLALAVTATDHYVAVVTVYTSNYNVDSTTLQVFGPSSVHISCSSVCAANEYANSSTKYCNSCPSNSESLQGSTDVTDCYCSVGFEGPRGGPCVAKQPYILGNPYENDAYDNPPFENYTIGFDDPVRGLLKTYYETDGDGNAIAYGIEVPLGDVLFESGYPGPFSGIAAEGPCYMGVLPFDANAAGAGVPFSHVGLFYNPWGFDKGPTDWQVSQYDVYFHIGSPYSVSQIQCSQANEFACSFSTQNSMTFAPDGTALPGDFSCDNGMAMAGAHCYDPLGVTPLGSSPADLFDSYEGKVNAFESIVGLDLLDAVNSSGVPSCWDWPQLQCYRSDGFYPTQLCIAPKDESTVRIYFSGLVWQEDSCDLCLHHGEMDKLRFADRDADNAISGRKDCIVDTSAILDAGWVVDANSTSFCCRGRGALSGSQCLVNCENKPLDLNFLEDVSNGRCYYMCHGF